MTRLLDDLNPDELRKRFLTCADPDEQKKWEALWLCSLPLGRTGARPPVRRVAEAVGMPLSGLIELIERYNDKGPNGVPARLRYENPGRPSTLTPEEFDRLVEAMRRDSALNTAKTIGQWVETTLGKSAHRSTYNTWRNTAQARLQQDENE